MQGLKTLADLRAAVRDRADMRALNRPTNEQLDRLINEKLKRTYALVALGDPSSYATLSGNLATTAGKVDLAALLPDFFDLLRVDAQRGSGWVPVLPFDLRQPEAPSGAGCRFRRQLRGNALVFTPAPPDGTVVRALYIPRLADLVNPADTFDGVNGWEGLAVIEAAIQLLNDEESDSSKLVRERDRLLDDLKAEVANRDQGEPYVVADVRDRDGW
jgi:hypothetical protein